MLSFSDANRGHSAFLDINQGQLAGWVGSPRLARRLIARANEL